MEYKKRGRDFIINSIFIVLVITSLFLIIKSETNSITGMQVLDATTAKLKLETALSSSSFVGMVTQGSMCVVGNDPAQPVSYLAINSGGSWSVTEEDDFFCGGIQSQDFLIMFSSYDDYSRIMDDPSPRNIVNGAVVRTFEILPSRHVEQGGNVICDAAFKVKYCDALKTMSTPDQLIEGDMVCCLDKLTRTQRKQLEKHLLDGAYRDEIGILEQPGGGINITNMFLLVVVLVVLGGGAAGYFLFAKKKSKVESIPAGEKQEMGKSAPAGVQAAGMAPMNNGMQRQTTSTNMGVPAGAQDSQVAQLKQYAYQTLQQGYTPQELYQHFVEQGWDQKTALEAVNEAIALVNRAG